MDIDPDAPLDSALNQQRTRGGPEQQMVSFGGDLADAPEPEEPEDEKNATAEAKRPIRVIESSAAAQIPRQVAPDSAAAPVSPPAFNRNAATSGRVDASPPQQPATAPNAAPRAQTSFPKAQTPQTDQSPQGTAPLNAATMAVAALTGALRRPEARAQPAAPVVPTGSPPSAPQSLLNRFAVKNILETLRGPQDQNHAAPPAATASLNSTMSQAANAMTTGGIRDKLTTFTTQRMQPRRDAEQVRDLAQAATGVVASLQALDQQETTGILNRIRDAAKANGGIESVLSEMRPGGQFEDLRKEFNTVLSHDQGFAAAYDKATGAIADYAETRAALPPSPRSDPNLSRLQTLDHEIAEAAKALPGVKAGQSALEDLAESGKEAVQKLFSAVQQAFNPNANLRGPSPSPGFGR
jgi:hypothetical protein